MENEILNIDYNKEFQDKLETFVKKMEINKDIVRNIIELAIQKNQAQTNNKIDIQYITSRTKTEESIKDKLSKKNADYTAENIRTLIHDYIGHRIVCLTQKDANDVIEILRNVEELNIKEEKDYFNNSKESGYRSFHMIIENPELYSTDNYKSLSEIQIRTLLQDVWSIFEHEIVYKKNASKTIKDEFQELSVVLLVHAEKLLNTLKEKEAKNNNKEEKDVLTTNKNYKKIEPKYTKNLIIYEAASQQLQADITKLKLQYSDTKKLISEHKRIKSLPSIVKKLHKNNHAITEENINKYIRDLIGYRAVCLTQKDAKELAELIIKNDQLFEVCEVKNYVDRPKESGYRGYNFKINIKIPISEKDFISVPAEIQILTALQNAWAAYEEQIVYNNPNCSEKAKQRLRYLSEQFNIIEDQLSEMLNKQDEHEKTLIKK